MQGLVRHCTEAEEQAYIRSDSRFVVVAVEEAVKASVLAQVLVSQQLEEQVAGHQRHLVFRVEVVGERSIDRSCHGGMAGEAAVPLLLLAAEMDDRMMAA